jgi:sigma-B regulation protein RsbU (phosphoserine phosphatase)
MGMLPFDFNPHNDSVEFAALLKPAKEVGGDLFDIFYIDNENLCVCLGDVSDKGAGSALFMAATKTLIKAHALNSKSTASIVSRINNELVKNNEKCMFTTLFVGIFHIETGSLLFSNCGHCYPFLVNDNMSISEVKELNGPAVGIMEGFSYSEQEISLTSNQTLLVYSDGVTESRNKAEDLYSELALKKLIKSAGHSSNPESLIHTVYNSVSDFEKGTEQSDDITILALKYKP